MEQHPGYQAEMAELQGKGFKIVSGTGDPHVVVRRVVGPDGATIRTDLELHVRPGMRFLDLEHELGHVRQITDPARFPKGPVPTEIVVEDARGRRNAPNQQGVLNTRQNAVLEYHNRLQELIWLDERGSTPAVLREHLDGIDGASGYKGWAERYYDATRGGAKSSITQWAREHFPDIPELQKQVSAIRERLKKGP
jgi:hypothetical protein